MASPSAAAAALAAVHTVLPASGASPGGIPGVAGPALAEGVAPVLPVEKVLPEPVLGPGVYDLMCKLPCMHMLVPMLASYLGISTVERHSFEYLSFEGKEMLTHAPGHELTLLWRRLMRVLLGEQFTKAHVLEESESSVR